MLYKRLTGLIFLFAIPATSCYAQDRCVRLFGGRTDPSVEVQALSPESKAVYSERACIRSYGLPGGADKLQNLTSAQIFKDKTRVEQLFDYYDHLNEQQRQALHEVAVLWTGDSGLAGRLRFMLHEEDVRKTLPPPVGDKLTMDDMERLASIDGGWNRDQVTRYGNFLYLRKLVEEHRYERGVAAGDRITQHGITY